MGRIRLTHTYNDIISLENLLEAWQEFQVGKRGRKDVQQFERNLMSNIFSLHNDLTAKSYKHSTYEAFNISDPKPRNIHKATVRDRLLHHALYRKLYPFFDRTFIADSYSCRLNKGTHKALRRFKRFVWKVSKNNTETAWVLKCDIRRFFASIDHELLFEIIMKYVSDKDIWRLVREIVGSFSTDPTKGLPLGNLTSQLLVNIYMNEFDQYVKHTLKVKYYIRYADDFVIFSSGKTYLTNMLPPIQLFLESRLRLHLHPEKVFIKTLASGVDFLGWIHFPNHRVLRPATKRRMFRSIRAKRGKEETVQSYRGLLRHGNSYKILGNLEKELERLKAV